MDETTIPDRIFSKLLIAVGPLTVEQICDEMPDVSRTSVNRALTKLKDRQKIEFHGRKLGWQAIRQKT